jgi:hypothetical protein
VITATNQSSDINGNLLANVSLPAGGWDYVILAYQGSNIWNGTFTVGANGPHTVRINATDYAGNWNYSGPVGIIGDISVPTIAISSILPDPSNGLTTIIATNTTSDISGNILANVSLPSGGWDYVTLIHQFGNIWQGTFTVTQDGIHTIRLNATDYASNTAYAGPQNITGDLTAPPVAIDTVLPDPSNGITIITASNISSDINGNILANISTRSGGWIHRITNYIGGDQWQTTFTVVEDGIYTVWINATDFAGNTGHAGPAGITGDVTAPGITLDTVLPDPSNGLTTITASNQSSDINGNILANISLPSGGWQHIALTYIGGDTWTENFTVTADGTYTVRINATDYAGNVNHSGPISITGDVTGPSISLDTVLPNPSNGLTTITASNTSNDIIGNVLANVSTPSSSWIHVTLTYTGAVWTGAFSVSENGVYSVMINATDGLGNTAHAGPLDITGDITAPGLAIDSISPDPSPGLTTIIASNTTSDINGNIIANISTPGGWLYSILTYNGSVWTGTFTVTVDGTHEVRINATDYAGNTGYAGPVSITGDISPPSITLFSVLPDPSKGVTTITATNTSTDINGNILANISTPSGWLYSTLTYNGSAWTGLFTVTVDGVHEVRINATDYAGNTGYAGPVSITGDSTPPSITVTSPIPSNTYNGTIIISATITDVSPIDNNSVYAIITGPVSYNSGKINLTYLGGFYTENWDSSTSTDGDGNYTIQIYANDTLANQQTSSAVLFIVENIVSNVEAGKNSTIDFVSSEQIQVRITINGNISGTLYINSMEWILDIPEGMMSIGIFINITFVPENPGDILGINFATLNITLTLELIAAAGDIDLSLIKIYHYNEATQEWEALNTTLIGNSFIAELSSLSTFGLFGGILTTDYSTIFVTVFLVTFGVILSFIPELLGKRKSPQKKRYPKSIKKKSNI